MTNDVHITPEGLVAVRKELDVLTTVRRPAIVAKIKAAREFGDLSENFEYHAAKNEQGMMEARINELEAIVKNHVLIETKPRTGVVDMGSTVRFTEDEIRVHSAQSGRISIRRVQMTIPPGGSCLATSSATTSLGVPAITKPW